MGPCVLGCTLPWGADSWPWPAAVELSVDPDLVCVCEREKERERCKLEGAGRWQCVWVCGMGGEGGGWSLCLKGLVWQFTLMSYRGLTVDPDAVLWSDSWPWCCTVLWQLTLMMYHGLTVDPDAVPWSDSWPWFCTMVWQLTLTLRVGATGVAAERRSGGSLSRGAGGPSGKRQVHLLPCAVPCHQPPQLQALRPRPLQRWADHWPQRRLPEHAETQGQLQGWLLKGPLCTVQPDCWEEGLLGHHVLAGQHVVFCVVSLLNAYLSTVAWFSRSLLIFSPVSCLFFFSSFFFFWSPVLKSHFIIRLALFFSLSFFFFCASFSIFGPSLFFFLQVLFFPSLVTFSFVFLYTASFFFVCVKVCMFSFGCDWACDKCFEGHSFKRINERVSEWERESVCVCVRARVCVCVCVCARTCVCAFGDRFFTSDILLTRKTGSMLWKQKEHTDLLPHPKPCL